MKKAVIFDMFETLVTYYNCPVYFGTQMAEDAGIPVHLFLESWRATEYDRSCGKITSHEVMERILKENNCYSPELLQKLLRKRCTTIEECFQHLHPEILVMLQNLKAQGVLIGLISNCYLEEAEIIRKSELFPYFDAVCLSNEQGIRKPDKEIFHRCMEMLGVTPEEYVYVGDGGSCELETAQELGMAAVQATWYFKRGVSQSGSRKSEFPQAETPKDILQFL